MVKLELRPYDALAILKFCREFINSDNINDKRFAAIHEAVNAYEKEIYNKVSIDSLEDAILENNINKITNRQPK